MKNLFAGALIVISVISSHASYAFDPEIEAIIRKAYELAAKGDRIGVLNCCHTEISQYKESFDTGYSPGRSGSLGELTMWAMGVESADEKITVANLKIEVLREDGDKAIAWANYHVIHDYRNSLSWMQGKPEKDEWDAKDYIILKKQKGQWRLRRLEDRAGHFLPVEQQQQSSDPYSGVE